MATLNNLKATLKNVLSENVESKSDTFKQSCFVLGAFIAHASELSEDDFCEEVIKNASDMLSAFVKRQMGEISEDVFLAELHSYINSL